MWFQLILISYWYFFIPIAILGIRTVAIATYTCTFNMQQWIVLLVSPTEWGLNKLQPENAIKSVGISFLSISLYAM